MSQNKFSNDSFEKFAEMGAGSSPNKPNPAQLAQMQVASGAAKSEDSTKTPNALLNPIGFVSELYGPTVKPGYEGRRITQFGSEQGKGGPKSTPLDTNKLNSKYTQQDMAAWRKRHSQFSSEIEQTINRNKQIAKQKIQQEEQAKKQKEEEARHAQAQEQSDAPQGKVRRSVLGGKPKRTVQTERNPETKASGSK